MNDTESVLIACSWCSRLIVDGQPGEPAPEGHNTDLTMGFSHGCCRECLAKFKAEADEAKAGREAA